MGKNVKTKNCEKHGEYTFTEIPGFDVEFIKICPACRDEEIAAESVISSDYHERQITKRLEDEGIPIRFLEASFDSYQAESDKQRDFKQVFEDYAEKIKAGSNESLFVAGTVGTGKTHLAIALIREIMSEVKDFRYTTVTKMIRDIRSSYTRESRKSEQDLIDEYASVKLLILDEVGLQLGTESEKILLFEVLNGRYENILPTVIISNLISDKMVDYLGVRVFDRLKTPESGLTVAKWDSYRQKGV